MCNETDLKLKSLHSPKASMLKLSRVWNCATTSILITSFVFLRKSCRLRSKCDGTRAETRFRLSPKQTSPFKSAGASVQSTTGSRVVRISGSNAEYTMFRGSVKSTGYPLHSPVSSSLPLPCVIVCHHISTGPYNPKFGVASAPRYCIVYLASTLAQVPLVRH